VQELGGSTARQPKLASGNIAYNTSVKQ